MTSVQISGMRTGQFPLAVVAAVWLTGGGPAGAQNYYPEPLYPGDGRLYQTPWSSVGLVRAKVGKKDYYGSGAVARDPRLVYGCAHVVFDRGVWAGKVEFARAYSDRKRPRAWTEARGYHLLQGYTIDEDFDADFAVAYAPTGFGQALNVYSSGADRAVENSALRKMILGYPSYRDFDYQPGYHYMHQTGPFFRAFSRVYGSFFEVDDVSTGPGNSGGPVVVTEGANQVLAGILVSGSEWPLSAGIYVLGPDAEAAANDALYDAENGTPRTVVARAPVRLRDGSTKYRRISFSFKKAPSSVTAVSLGLQMIATPGEVDAYVRSPSGRVRVVVDAFNKATYANQNNWDIDVSDTFAGGSDGSGKWALFCRDIQPGAAAAVGYAALTIAAR